WLAARRGDANAERRALEEGVGDEPGDCAAWERLAVLATEAGHIEAALRLRRRKAEMDRARQRYGDPSNRNPLAADSAEFARLAESLGRRFEAIGFRTWIAQQSPGDRDAAAALARLRGAEVPAGTGAAGQTLAQVLAADLGSGPPPSPR